MSRPLSSFFLITPVAAGILALALGVVCIAADIVEPNNGLLQVLLVAGLGPAPWAAVAFVVGAIAGRSGGGAFTGMFWGVAALVAADGIYYLGHVYLGTRSMSEVLVRSALVWGAVAIVAGLGFGAAGAVWANGRPAVAGIALALVAATLLVEASYLAGNEILEVVRGASFTEVDQGRTIFALIEAVIGVGLILVAPRGGRTTFAVSLAGAAAAAFLLGPILMDATSTVIQAG